jgi:hemerythrin-like domain-containing protein
MPTQAKKKSSKKNSKSPCTKLLEKQHREAKALFQKLEKGGGNPKEFVQQLADALAAHMAIEQEIYYPAVKKVDEDMIFESFEEHAMAELGLKRLLATKPKDASFQAHVTAVKELIEHHVEEEEGDLFPNVDKKLDAGVLAELAAEMEERFEAVKKKGFRAAVPKGAAPTVSGDFARAS